MGRLWGGGALLLLALFMAVGMAGAEVEASALAFVVAGVVAVGLPAAAGTALLAGHFGAGRRREERRDALRRQTLEAEVLTLAAAQAGRLTAVEVAAALAMTTEEAKDVLDALMTRGTADLEVTDSGVLVYTFHDVRHLDEKSSARGILE